MVQCIDKDETDPQPAKRELTIEKVITHILTRPGPLTTPRDCYKTVTFSERTFASQKVKGLFSQLQTEGLGHFHQQGKEICYFKPLPTEVNKRKITEKLASPNISHEEAWDKYVSTYLKIDEAQITQSQMTRFLRCAPKKDELKNYFPQHSALFED